MDASDCIALSAAIIAALALAVSFSAKREAKKIALLPRKLEAIEQVRKAMSDILFDDHIDRRTTSSLAEAIQLSKMVFSGDISSNLKNLHGIAFHLEGKPCSQRTEQEAKDRDFLADHFKKHWR